MGGMKNITMKKVLSLFLSDNALLGLQNLKKKFFPNKKQKARIKQEAENITKRRLFYNQFIGHNDLCFDVGANVGNRVSTFLDIGTKVVAVEPQESCCRILKNKFGNKIEIISKGLGESECVKDFYVSDASTISSFSVEWINLVKENRFKEYNWDKIIKIEITTLDKLIEQYGVPAFIKIDVEGYESDVLKGLHVPVKMISFEYTVPEQLNKITDCIKLIEKNDANIECNYSTGESMSLAFHEWQPVEKMQSHIHTKEFISTGFGDIYVRLKK